MPDSGRKYSMIATGWRNLRSAGRQRLALTALLVVLAILLARFSWYLPITGDAERGLFDYRSALTAQKIEQDPRILLVVYDDQTLIAARKRSPLDRGLLAKALANLDAMGAKAIGIDILFDQPQDEDDQLVAALRAMNTPTYVALAEMATNPDDIEWEQQEFLKSFVARLAGSKAQAASIRLDNTYGATRIWPSIEPGLPPVLGRAMLIGAGEQDKSLPGYTGAIRYRIPALRDAPIYTELQIDNFVDPELAPAMADAVRGRYVLIGGDIIDFDRVATTLTSVNGDMPAGLAVHADLIAQMLDGARLPAIAPWTIWLLAVLVAFAAALTGLLELRSWRIYPLLFAQFALFLGAPFLLQWRGVDTYNLPAFGWLLAWILAFTAVTSAARASTAVQRQFAQGALGKYIPRSIAEELVDKPHLLALHGEKKEIFVLFSDLEGFTQMSHALTPEMVAKLLNRYLEMLSQVVLDHGGVIDKFVGDAVVAFWGAPIAREGDGERAAQCGYAIWQAGEDFRAEVAAMDPNLPKVGKTRVGLHWGEAVVGNFGGERRIQYTALGDSMNTAARLEAANKPLKSSVMASREFAERSGLDWWRAMGRIVLRGRAQPVDIYEPAPDFPVQDRQTLDKAVAIIRDNRAAAIEMIEEIASRYPADKALENLLMRTQNLSEDGTYVLG
ncbi:MAG: adenylate/guanylate cyclase domain-containing protein [Sphingomonadales bacterium]|nr:adenylate/guanylate cyclase domain-containing protein [Sphingomonadales bacterium]MBD3772710.1 adenylate/guanylate cyclase domain-containing protein [Paracoccaceae bacterium]